MSSSRHYAQMLFVDTLSVTIQLPINRRIFVDEQMTYVNEWSFCNLLFLDATKTGYREFYRLEINGTRIADVFIRPNRVCNNYIRIEYSPRNVGEEGRSIIAIFLEFVLGATWLEDFCNGNLTRIDLAVDVPHLSLNSLIIKDVRSNKKSQLIRGFSEKLETYYFPPNGNKQMLVYNKLQERLDRGIIQKRPDRLFANKTRFEYRQRSLKGYSLSNFHRKQNKRNPFRHFKIKKFFLNDHLIINKEQQAAYFNLLRFMNVKDVLCLIENHEIKRDVEDFYKSLPSPNFFKFNTLIWNGLRHAIQDALPLA